MNIGILADLHLGSRRFRKQKNHQNAWKLLNYAAFEEALESLSGQVDAIFIAGDVFDSYNPDVDALVVSRKLEELYIPVYAISGNHDVSKTMQETTGVHCFDALRHNGSNVHWISTPEDIHINGVHVFFLPFGYLTPEYFHDCISKIQDSELNCLVCHGYLDVGQQSDANDPLLLPKQVSKYFDLVVIGHVHLPSVVGNSRCRVLTPGSLMPSSASLSMAKENGLPKHYIPSTWIWNIETNSIGRYALRNVPTLHNVRTDTINDALKNVNDGGIWNIVTSQTINDVDEAIYKKALESSLYLHLQTAEIQIKKDDERNIIPDFWEWCKKEHSEWYDNLLAIKNNERKRHL